MLYERRLQSGRTVLALFDPHMRPQLGAHVWSERAHGRFGGLYTETGPHAGRTSLARWTAEECLLGASQVALGVVGWRHKDACPANCLARNLEVQLAATVPEAAPLRQHTARQARQAARAALQQLYAAVGAEEGRRFLQALHKEQQVLQAAAH